MSVVLDNPSQEYLYTSTQPFTVKPITISAWFKSTTIAAGGVIVALSDDNAEFLLAQARGIEAGDPAAAMEHATGWVWASSSTGFSADTWHHVAAVFVSATERIVYLDGVGKTTNTDSQDVNFSLFSKVLVGTYKTSTGFFDGKLAEVALWSSELSDAQILNLAGGAVATGIDDNHIPNYVIKNMQECKVS